MTKETDQLEQYRENLKGKLENLRVRREVNAMETALGLAGQQMNIMESGGVRGGTYTSDMIRKEVGFDDIPSTAYSQPHDRQRGNYEPFISNELDLSRIRALGRFFSVSDCAGVGIKEALINYVVGEGFNYDVKAARNDAPDELVAVIRHLTEMFLEVNNWKACREEMPIAELISDGEVFLILRDHEDGVPRIRIRTGEHFTEPIDTRSLEEWSGYQDLDWSYGIGTPWGESEAPIAYFAQWYGDINAWEVLGAERVEHIKLNVPEDVKRGISDYYAAAKELERAGKGINAVAIGATIQATIAMIEKSGDGATATEIEAALLNPNIFTGTAQGSTGAYDVKFEDHLMGRVMRTSGKDVMYGPMGTPRGSQLADTFGAVLRRVAVRWGLTEFMVSGDASNNNMASSVVAESPMNRGMKRRQRKISKPYISLIWKAVELMAEQQGILRKFDLPMEVIKRLVAIDITGDEPAERDAQVDENIRKERHNAGILSLKTWAEEVDIDYEEEVERGAKKAPVPAPGMGGPGGPGGPPPPPGGGNPGGPQAEQPKPISDQRMEAVIEDAMEHVRTIEEAKAIVKTTLSVSDQLAGADKNPVQRRLESTLEHQWESLEGKRISLQIED